MHVMNAGIVHVARAVGQFGLAVAREAILAIVQIGREIAGMVLNDGRSPRLNRIPERHEFRVASRKRAEREGGRYNCKCQ